MVAGDETQVEVFGVVAAPESGVAIRVTERRALAGCDAVELGRVIAARLMEAGAAELLAGGAAR
jgi:hypothetical protein